MTQTMTPYTTTSMVIAKVSVVDEDLVRKSLIDAIELLASVKHNKTGGWFAFNTTAQNYLMHATQHLNDELDALLRGDYVKFTERQLVRGRKRDEGACV